MEEKLIELLFLIQIFMIVLKIVGASQLGWAGTFAIIIAFVVLYIGLFLFDMVVGIFLKVFGRFIYGKTY